MGVVAVLPTAAAFAVYATLGHAWDMWFATVTSIFLRNPLTWAQRIGDVPQMLLYLTVPVLVTASCLAARIASGWQPRTVFLAGWMAAALVGFIAVPNLFNHYTLPLILPMSVIMALPFADERDGLILATMVVAIPIVIEAPLPRAIIHDRDGFDRAANFIRRELHGGCLYIHHGPTALYSATNACHLSPYVFPDHLESEVEATALPVSPETEVERIFRFAPTVVVTGHRKFLDRNNRTAAIVERHLWCDYRLARRVPDSTGRTLDIWTLRADPPVVCPTAHPPLGLVQRPGD